MKILAILGSPHKGSSYHAIKIIETALKRKGKVDFEYLFLKDANLKTCAGCFQCLQKGQANCPHKDDRDRIIDKMQAADGIIFSSPVYVMGVTGLMKNFIDRLAFSCHRPMFHKHGLAIANTGAMGQGQVSKYMADVMRIIGFWTVERVGIVTSPFDVKNITPKARKALVAAAERFHHNIKQDSHSPSLMSLIQFRVQQQVFLSPEIIEQLPCDYDFYKPLHGKKYYTEANVGFFKNAIALAVAKAVKLFI